MFTLIDSNRNISNKLLLNGVLFKQFQHFPSLCGILLEPLCQCRRPNKSTHVIKSIRVASHSFLPFHYCSPLADLCTHCFAGLLILCCRLRQTACRRVTRGGAADTMANYLSCHRSPSNSWHRHGLALMLNHQNGEQRYATPHPQPQCLWAFAPNLHYTTWFH